MTMRRNTLQAPAAPAARTAGIRAGGAFALLAAAWWCALLAVALACGAAPAAYADAEHAAVAPSSATAKAKSLLREGMAPITADQVKDGVYEAEAESSSTFFKVKGATLTVRDGAMQAAISIDSKSYPLVFPGTPEEAAAAPASAYIPFDDDTWTFTVPVQALDQEMQLAAFSKRRAQWYGRTLVFYAASLPEGALLVDKPVYGDLVDASDGAADQATGPVPGTVHEDGYEAVALDMPDGEYSIEVNMTGGSGRASVSSPTWLVVQDGHAYARLLWSSSYYDYMIVEEQRYDNLTDDGSNSTFLIPIVVMDDEMHVVADTTAMGDPLEIEYALTFYSGTIGDKMAIPQEAAIRVLEIAVVIIVLGGILNHVLNKRRKR